jgi:hypothetical protein
MVVDLPVAVFSSSFASDFLRFDSSSDDLSSFFSSAASDFFLVDLSSSFDVFVSDLVVSFSSVFLLVESASSVSQPRLRRPVVAASAFFSKNEKQ